MSISLPIIFYILVMAGVTYLIRSAPFLLLRRRIKSQYLQSVLYYLPYCVLSAMTLPAVLTSTGSILTALAGFAVAVVLSLLHRSLLTVALGASAAAYLAGLIISLL